MRYAIAALAAGILAAVSYASGSIAAERDAYTPALFAAAQAHNEPIVVHVTASWCPTCQVQNRVIEGALFKPQFANVRVLDVDFDDQKDVVAAFGATEQSTLVFFHGKTIVARLVGATDAAAIEAMMQRAVDGR
ncbi:MAG: thioredoxin family protein [Alphaproteobacteria bacterium]|nr:thioredoxin family protein [Alphaproteobacteria bacterium]MBL6938296.1 thioredoxin family protein [Alphaproteobacteria bacterium]MBL7097352.1 thioredoxin family protein [Alphaproteobacteria bacterium]